MPKHLTYLLWGFLWLGNGLWAQSGFLKVADAEFAELNYSRAIVAYEAASDKNLRAYRNLATCYQVLGRLEAAEGCLEWVCSKSKRTPEDLWKLGQVLLQQGKYSSAEAIFQEFYRSAPRDSRARRYRNVGNFESLLTQNADNYELRYLPFNTPDQDFGPAFLKKQLVFTTTRTRFSPIVREWNGNEKGFLDLYLVNPYLKEAEPVPFNRSFNQKLHDGPISFNKAGNFCVLTRSNYRIQTEEGVTNFGLYFSKKASGKWSEPEPFPFNDPNFSLGQASLSADGKTVYFASDMPGGKGGTDIWYSEKKEGEWSEPIPIYSINTEGNETFPFYLESGVILFASDGLFGLGGLDLFAAKLEDKHFVKIRNLGAPVNSSWDDFGLKTDPQMRRGFYSSNRPAPEKIYGDRRGQDTLNRMRDDDIYSLKFLVPFDFGKTIYGTVVDDNQTPLENARIQILTLDGTPVKSTFTSEEGAFEFYLDDNGSYQVLGEKDRYFVSRDTLVIDTSQEDYSSFMVLRRDPNISIRLLITDSQIGDPMPGVNLTVQNLETGEIERFLTDRSGEFSRKLPQKGLRDTLSYRFKIEREGFLTKTLNYTKAIDQAGAYEIHKARINRRNLDFSMRRKTIGDDLALQLGILPYFYEADKGQIEPLHRGLLDEIVQALRDNPELKIRVVNHTDCTGDRQTNLELSKERASAIRSYLIAAYPEADGRIAAEGKGDLISKSNCSCYARSGSNCTEEDYQIDRRTDFIITAIE